MVDSISKTRVDRDTAGAIVRDAFGDALGLDEFEECTEGWFNAVYRLRLSDGRTCVLKVAPPPEVRVLTYEHDIITTEVDALRLVRDRTSVPVPAVLWWDDSSRRVPSPYFVMECCDGVLLSAERATLTDAQQTGIDRQLAGFLAQMNAITDRGFGRPDRAATRWVRWSDAFACLVGDLLADGEAADVELPVGSGEVTDLLRRHASALDAVTEPRFVHWDLWDTNVFVDPTTLAVLGIIDFERVLWADPLMEAQFAGKRADDELTDAYGTPLFAAESAVERRLLYDLYLYLVMTIECAYRHYPTDEIEQLGRACLAATLDELGDLRP